MTTRDAGATDPADKAEARRLAALRTPAENRRRRVIGLLWLLIGLLLVVAGWTAFNLGSRLAAGDGAAVAPDSVGARAAVAYRCEQHGPISRVGLGYWWECFAKVRAANGNEEGRRFGNSELTPADIGKPVPAYVIGGSVTRSSYAYRNVSRPLEWLGKTLFWVCLVLALGFLGNALLRLIPLTLRLEVDSGLRRKLAAQYAAEGRQPGGYR